MFKAEHRKKKSVNYVILILYLPFHTRARDFLLLQIIRVATGPNRPPIQCVPGSFPAAKWLGCDVDHSPPPSAEVKNEWIYTSLPPLYVFTVWTGRTVPYLLIALLVTPIMQRRVLQSVSNKLERWRNKTDLALF